MVLNQYLWGQLDFEQKQQQLLHVTAFLLKMHQYETKPINSIFFLLLYVIINNGSIPEVVCDKIESESYE